MITYKTIRPSLKVPVLHRVYHSAPLWIEVYDWCKKNCKHPFYTSPAWRQDKFVEFECDEDAALAAIWFPLRW